MSSNHNRIPTYYIYKITNNLNGKTYIGQHKCPDNKTPWTDTSYTGSGIQIIQAKKKYGIKNFSKEILAICHTYDTINTLEIAFIALYRSIGKAEYNIANGGQSGTEGLLHSEETKQKIREARARQVISEETRRKISEANKGKTFSAETRRKISESQKGKVVSEETRQKIREARAKQAPMSEEGVEKRKNHLHDTGNPKPDNCKEK